MKWTTLGMVMLTAFGVSASHVFWESEFWRQPFLWTDRWHILSFLSWQPICAWAIVQAWDLDNETPLDLLKRLLTAMAACAVIWTLVKAWGGKDWSFWPCQAWRWWRG